MRPTWVTRWIPGTWRWRPNPLRRRSDLIEAWVGLVIAVVVAAGAPVLGIAAGRAVDASLLRTVVAQRAERHEVRATVLSAARAQAAAVDPDDTNSVSRTAVLGWRSGGSAHRATVTIVGRHSVGSTLPVWLDRRDRPVEPPLDKVAATTNATAAGLSAAAATAGLLLAARRFLSWRILRRRMADWGREWSRVGQDWGHAGTGG